MESITRSSIKGLSSVEKKNFRIGPFFSLEGSGGVGRFSMWKEDDCNIFQKERGVDEEQITSAVDPNPIF
jgi:hypothetical protein